MPDAIEEAKSVVFTMDTRSVYTRIGKISSFQNDFLKNFLFSFNL